MALKTLGSGDTSETEASIIAEINITPLTDIFLVLLIIFMVTSSVMSQLGVDVDLPQASPAMAKNQPDGVIVTLVPGGALKVNEVKVEAGQWAQFEDLLKQAFAQTKERLIILEGDRKAFLGNAIEVMDHARQAGAVKFAIATQPE